MAKAQTVHTQLLEEDYLAGERLSPERHEYVDGQVYLIAGASKRHSEIAVNLTTALRLGVRKTSCNVLA